LKSANTGGSYDTSPMSIFYREIDTMTVQQWLDKKFTVLKIFFVDTVNLLQKKKNGRF
jgi:hypothetical protein